MDNNTLLFQDKGSGGFKDVKIYPNRIEVGRARRRGVRAS